MAKPITEKRLYNMALFYLSKYEASAQKLRQTLQKRVLKAAAREEFVPDNADSLIEKVIAEMIRLGYVNDARYAESQVRRLTGQGKSASFIRQKLKQAGISTAVTDGFLKETAVSDANQALVWLKKHRKGGYRSKQAVENHKKDLAALARQGFSFAEAQEALKASFQDQTVLPDFDEDAF